MKVFANGCDYYCNLLEDKILETVNLNTNDLLNSLDSEIDIAQAKTDDKTLNKENKCAMVPMLFDFNKSNYLH